MVHAKAPSATATAAAASPEPSAVWTRSEDKLLEMLVVRYSPPRWDVIASRLPGKTPQQARQRFQRTVDEVTRTLQALHVETPREWDTQRLGVAASPVVVVPTAAAEKARVPALSAADGEESKPRAKREKRKREMAKREMWTEEEHNLFLKALEICGKGKWKEMSSVFVTTKTAEQIASHHQKFCKRLEQRKRKSCKRASIHDITEPTTNAAAVVAAGGGQPAAQRDELGRGVEEPKAAGELVEAVEEFPCEYDLEALFL